MGLREFISKSRPGFRAAFFWFAGSKRGVGVEKPLVIVPFALTGYGIWNAVLSFLCGANHSHARKERPLVTAGLMSVVVAGALQDGWIVVWCGRWIESSASSPSF